MANINVATTVQDELNRCMPAAKYARLGDLLVHLITNMNAMQVSYTALAAKLDADAGVTDTNYGATVVPAITAITTLENR